MTRCRRWRWCRSRRASRRSRDAPRPADPLDRCSRREAGRVGTMFSLAREVWTMTLLEYVAALAALVLVPWLAAQRLASPVDGPDPRATFEAARARHTRRALMRRADASALP